MEQRSDAPYWLALLCAAGLSRQVGKRAIQRWAVELGRPLAELFAETPASLATILEIDEQLAAQILAQRELVSRQAAQLRDLAQRQVYPLTRLDTPYPDALLERLPEERLPYLLMHRGSLELLTEPGVVVLGAGLPTAEALALATALGQALAAAGHLELGGFGRGVDRGALEAAIAAGGTAACVLPVGIGRVLDAIETFAPALREGRLLALSPYPCDTPYSEVLAVARLPLVLALAGALILVDPDLGPADWPATEALRAFDLPVLIWAEGEETRLQSWMYAGATPFDTADEALALVAERFGAAAPPDAAPGVEEPSSAPIAFRDADSAIEILGRSGHVPPGLERRLRERAPDSSTDEEEDEEDDAEEHE